MRAMRRRSSWAKSSFASRSLIACSRASPVLPVRPALGHRAVELFRLLVERRHPFVGRGTRSRNSPIPSSSGVIDNVAVDVFDARDQVRPPLQQACGLASQLGQPLTAQMVEQRPGPGVERQPGVDVSSAVKARDSPVIGQVLLDLPHDGGGAFSLGEHGQQAVIPLREEPTDDLDLGRQPLALVLALDPLQQIVHQAQRQLGGGQGDEPRLALVDLLLELLAAGACDRRGLPVSSAGRLELLFQPLDFAFGSPPDVLELAALRLHRRRSRP